MAAEEQPNINPGLSNHPSQKLLDLDTYIIGILNKDRSILAQAITLVESTIPERQAQGQQILDRCLEEKNDTIRIAITGSPGVGKSTFIETLGLSLIQKGLRVAVLAIDPSSSITAGSILGDKTRMPKLSTHPDAFIRPTAAGKTLGGVASNTRQSIALCEAAKYDIVLIETVGVGQSETLVHSMVDFFLLLILPGAGDELQGIKRGIVEMADLIVVSKADGDREQLAQETRRDYMNALRLFPQKESNWQPEVLTNSVLKEKGVEEIWDKIQHYRTFTTNNGFFTKNRQHQAQFWMHEVINNALKEQFYEHLEIKKQITLIENQVKSGKITPNKGAQYLLQLFKN